MENSLENNPIAVAITEKVRELLFEDMSKADIKEKIKSAHPNFSETMFEACFSETFTTLAEF